MMSNDDIHRMIHWNCNGIRSKLNELYSYMIDNNINLACLNETRLREGVKIPLHRDFRVIRMDNNGGGTPHGGVAIVVKKSIRHEILPQIQLETIECIGIKIYLLQRELKVFAAYHTGTVSQQNLPAFRRDIRKLTSIGGAVTFADMNARHQYWGCQRQNAAGRILYDELCVGNFEIHYPAAPTYYPSSNRTPSTLDIMLSTTDIVHEPLQVADDLGSDHYPIIATIYSHPTTNANFASYLNFNKADWDKYRRLLNQSIDLKYFQLPSSCSTSDIDHRIESLTHIMMNAASASVPRKRSQKQLPLMTQTIRELIQRRRSLKRRLDRGGDQQVRDEYNIVRHQIEYNLQCRSNENFQHHIENFIPGENNNRKLWGMSRILRGRYRPLPFLKSADQMLMTDRERAEAFADSFEQNHETTAFDPISSEVGDDIEACMSHLNDSHDEVDPSVFVKLKELKDTIRQLPSNKAPGEDSVRNLMLKNCSRKCLVAFLYILNACLANCYFPNSWKNAIMIPILKPGKPSDLIKSFRPISLLSVLAKVFERILLTRMLQHIDEGGTFPDFQFGFRSGHSTSHQVKRVTNIIQQGFSSKQSTGVVLLDLQCAFDSVWHDALILKMHKTGFPIYMIKLIKSYLQERTFRVKVNSTLSTPRRMIAGVPQGGVLSPVLFNIKMYDLPEFPRCQTAQFADDVALTSTDRRAACVLKSLNDAVKSFSKYATKWRFKLNPSKTEATFFTRRTSARAFPRLPLNVNGHTVHWSNQCKYLGVVLDQKLLYRAHIDYVIERCGKCIKLLYGLLSRNSRLHPTNKIRLFTVVLRPMLLYASPVWCNCANTHRKRLQILQNRILKMCLSLHWRYSTHQLHQDANVEMIQQVIEKLTQKFIDRCGAVPNPLINNLYP